jgi:sulfite oxidase
VKGYAYSGGGRGIVRVDVSADGGETWTTAELGKGAEQPMHKAWAWTLWSASVPLPEGAKKGAVKIVCKAVDAAHNQQPERTGPIWNLRGILNNSWHGVNVNVEKDS